MNLLTDPWIPIQDSGKTALIPFRQVLCDEQDFRIAMPRDDMELACLQLMVCLAQVLFPVADKKALLARIRQALSDDEYDKAITDRRDWFDLGHAETPFMQVRGVQAKEVTPIQKLFVGLPEGNNHAFFNAPGEVAVVSEAMAAIALFNQAMNAPSMGGGFKGGFRGGAPITSLMSGTSLRQQVWVNVLHGRSLAGMLPGSERSQTDDQPVWVQPIKAQSRIAAADIGLLRGLFWQPAHFELVFADRSTHCDVLDLPIERGVTGFLKEKFVYEIVGDWLHPHSPRVQDLKTNTTRYLSFNTSAPAWTQLNHLLVGSTDKKQGHYAAEVVQQFKRDLARPSQLIVGGYRNKQASILQRRHELFPLRPGWDKNDAQITVLVTTALDIKDQLRKKLYGFAKASGAHGVNEKAELLYYHQSEPLIHKTLREIDWDDAGPQLQGLQQELIDLSWVIFDQVTHPYAHEPKMIKALATARRNLRTAFKKLRDNPR
jgi:CRISPR system Cascade subunit CasA